MINYSSSNMVFHTTSGTQGKQHMSPPNRTIAEGAIRCIRVSFKTKYVRAYLEDPTPKGITGAINKINSAQMAIQYRINEHYNLWNEQSVIDICLMDKDKRANTVSARQFLKSYNFVMNHPVDPVAFAQAIRDSNSRKKAVHDARVMMLDYVLAWQNEMHDGQNVIPFYIEPLNEYALSLLSAIALIEAIEGKNNEH